MIERLEALPYALPLRWPWRTGQGAFSERRGWLVRVGAGGLAGYGDCAPLPAAGTETPQVAHTALEQLRAEVVGRSVDEALTRIAENGSPAPAARFAVESALLDLAAHSAGLPLCRLLRPEATPAVRVNAALGAALNVKPEALDAACRAGFQVVKLKVGLSEPTTELAKLAALSRRLPPGAALRLDANGAWGLEEAARVIADLNDLPVESLEEPLREPTAAGLSRLQSAAGFPLALDESLPQIDPRLRLTESPVRRLVLKPAVVGGLRRTLAVAARAHELGLEVVITSVVDTAAGIWPTVQLAAAVGSPLTHGLATSGWLAADLGGSPDACAGRIVLPPRPGSGFCPRHDWRSHV